MESDHGGRFYEIMICGRCLPHYVFSGGGGEIAQIVVFIAIRQRTQVFAAVPAGDSYPSDSSLLCQRDAVPFGKHGTVRKLIPGNFSIFAYQPGNAFGVLIGNRVHNVDVCGQISDSAVFFLIHGSYLPFPRMARRYKNYIPIFVPSRCLYTEAESKFSQ